MRKKCFLAFEKQVNRIIDNNSDRYAIYNLVFEKKVKEQKANSCSWGGYEEMQYLQEFNSSINKTVEDMFNEIKAILETIGRKLTKKQYEIVAQKCVTSISSYIDNYQKKFEETMGHINRTQETSLTVLKGNTSRKAKDYFELFQFISYNKLDKAYRVAIISTIIAGTSALISLAGVVLSIVLK